VLWRHFWKGLPKLFQVKKKQLLLPQRLLAPLLKALKAIPFLKEYACCCVLELMGKASDDYQISVAGNA
jgi:hypothetical protein